MSVAESLRTSVVKNAYVASSSGWFLCRSACYLSSDVPVIVQHTGFGWALAKRKGTLAFSTLQEAHVAIEELAAAPERDSRAAREIAHEYFDTRKVLTHLLEQAL